MYEDIKSSLKGLLEPETNFITNSSNFAALLFEKMDRINWVGFYMIAGESLLLGPFCGKPACIRIDMGKGVCGSAANKRKTLVVDDVHEFPGHIACDEASESEIVIPLIKNDKLYGVLDIDSPVKSRFSFNDMKNLDELAKMLVNSSDMEAVHEFYNKMPADISSDI
ncbi:MAG: GAF domain-containing protein [Candidatus Kapaibacterium sp.]